MLSVTYAECHMLVNFMLNVVMLSIVAPTRINLILSAQALFADSFPIPSNIGLGGV